MKTTVLLILFGSMAIIAAGILYLLSAVRKYRRDLGLEPEKHEKTQDMSFIITAFQDVTRQLKEKEKELERLRELAERRADAAVSATEHILRSITSGVIAFDERGVATTVNRAAEMIVGVERTVGRSCAELFGAGTICADVAHTLERKAPISRLETAFDRKGERLWLGYNTSVLTDPQGRAMGVILSFSDLTEVKRLQEQVELRERLTALGEMSAGIAHELRNPMAVITGYLNLLTKKQDEQGRKVIQDIMAEITGMNQIIGDLLTFARPTSLNRTTVNLADMLRGCISVMLEKRGGAGGIVADVDLDDVVLAVDEGLVRQAMANIVQNACDAMPGGGTVSISLRRTGGEAVITIGDTGSGIAPDIQKKIFLPFFTTRDAGVGMGLALTHKIVASHGGRIAVESPGSGGTTFTIVLPAA